MTRHDGGWYVADAIAPPGTPYAFRLSDGLTVPDPASRAQQDDVHGNSLVVDPGGYTFQNESWANRPWHEAVLYELHPGTFGGFNGIRARLAELASLGITAIELMPVADFPGRHNWGYDGVLPFAPDRAYGSPDELKAMIDEAHGLGLMVFLDVVYNHFGPDGAYLHAYAKPFFDESVETPWGAAIDFKRPEVCAYFIENATMWLNEYRFDGLRFDATHAISPQSFLADLATALRENAKRPVHLVLEHENNVASLLRGPEAGLFDAQWDDDFHHCIHVLLTGENEGYYESFPQPAKQLARVLAEGFAFQGEVSPHENRPRGEPTAGLSPSAFVVGLQNHDQIGNRAFGERLTALAHPDSVRASATLHLLSPMIPLIFMGEEWGSRTPFLFFTDHNEELAELVRQGRRREFKHFAAFAGSGEGPDIPDPNAASTFEASIPDPDEAAQPACRAHLPFYRELLALRHQHIIPGIPGCVSEGADVIGTAAVYAAWRLGTGNTLVIFCNFGESPLPYTKPALPLLFSSGNNANAGVLPPRSSLVFFGNAGAEPSSSLPLTGRQ